VSVTGSTFCEVMTASETPRKAPQISADRTGEDAIYASAVTRFVEIYDFLAALGAGASVPLGQRMKVWQDFMSQVGGAAKLSPIEAKRAQLEASAGRPLTFCFGRICRVPELKQLVDAKIVWGDGCGVVFADSVTSSRPVFRRYCSACGKSKGRQRRREDIIDRVSAMVWSERLPALGGWRVTCSNCGERFFARTPQRRRCDNCRH
jgi:hypothetical protein